MTDEEFKALLTDEHDYNAIHMVPVSFILRNAIDSCDFGPPFDGDVVSWWQAIISDKAGDSGFGHLVDSILKNGWRKDSAIGFDGEYINEGHHRLVAAILLCLDEVPVSAWGRSGRDNLCAHYSTDEHSIHV